MARRKKEETYEPEPEETEEEETDIELDEDEAIVWVSFYNAIVSGAAAGAGKAIDVVVLAQEADEMMEQYRARLGKR